MPGLGDHGRMVTVRLSKRTVVALALAAGLTLSACGDDATEPTGGETTATQAPTDVPTGVPEESPSDEISSYEPPTPTKEFEWKEGDVDPVEFEANYGQGMRGIEHVLITTDLGVEGESSSVYVDNTDPEAPMVHDNRESGGFTIETVVRDGEIWSRMDEGEWERSGEYESYDIGTDLVPQASKVTLVDAEKREFELVLAEGEEGAPEPVPATLVVDEDFRGQTLTMDLSGETVTTTYDYETQQEIPEVG